MTNSDSRHDHDHGRKALNRLLNALAQTATREALSVAQSTDGDLSQTLGIAR